MWRGLVTRYEADIFCGLFLRAGNEGANLSPRTLAEIGGRGLSLDFDIYGPEANHED